MDEKKKVKDKRTTFRMDDAEYERFCKDAASCGMGLSSYIRSRVAHGMDKVFYDPAMTEELRSYRTEIRSLVQEIELVRRHIDRDNYVQTDELRQIQVLVRSVYRKMDAVEGAVGQYRKELMQNGNYKAAQGKIRGDG